MTTKCKNSIVTLPTILLVGSGMRRYREYMLRMISKHANVWLLLDNVPQWELEYICGFFKVNTLDPIKMKSVLPDTLNADGVLCWDEIRIIPSAKLALSLGLPGGNVDSIIACRDKFLTRQSLSKLDVSQPAFVLTQTLDQAKQAINHLGYPAIVKPRAMAASYGVSKVENEEELEIAFESASGATEKCEKYIAESYEKAKLSVSVQ